MKSATLLTYTPYGTSHTAVDVLYRNRLLTSFEGFDKADLIGKATAWVLNQGFTGTKLVKG